MREIPLPIQRKIAREGHFLAFFVSHSNDKVALETLPHLYKKDDITRFLRIPTINRLVLTDLAKRRRFFRKEMPRLALLQTLKHTLKSLEFTYRLSAIIRSVYSLRTNILAGRYVN